MQKKERSNRANHYERERETSFMKIRENKTSFSFPSHHHDDVIRKMNKHEIALRFIEN